MQRGQTSVILKRQSRMQMAALGALLFMLGLAVAGPSGLLAWSDNLRMLDQRQQELKQIQQERDELKNRVGLLDQSNPDADLQGELLRRDLNVVHQDEMIMLIK